MGSRCQRSPKSTLRRSLQPFNRFVPTSLEEIDRPVGMARNDRPEDQDFAPTEWLYRRIHPNAVEIISPGLYRVTPEGWTDVVRMSVVRGKYATADHARWESGKDPEEERPDFKPRLFREWYVAKIARSALDPQGGIRNEAGAEFTFHPKHIPFDDLYAHSEVQTLKDAHKLQEHEKTPIKRGQFNEKARLQYQGWLTNNAVVVLTPDQVDEASPPPQA
jgi:hypothetical protein